MLDLLITNATLPDGRADMSVAVQGGRIVEVTQGLAASTHETVDAAGYLLSPPFCDPHFHLDATLSYGLPRYGLDPGCDASFVLLQATSTIEAIRLRATRLKVWRKGKLLAQTPEVVTRLMLAGRPSATRIARAR